MIPQPSAGDRVEVSGMEELVQATVSFIEFDGTIWVCDLYDRLEKVPVHLIKKVEEAEDSED